MSAATLQNPPKNIKVSVENPTEICYDELAVNDADSLKGDNPMRKSDFCIDAGRQLPCYLLSKMGCEMISTRLTGEKGILFTAAYFSQFNAMENFLRTEREKMQAMKPTLSDCNDTAYPKRRCVLC